MCREFHKTNLPWNYRLSDQLQYSVMDSRTSNQAWSKSLDAGANLLSIVTAELQTANVTYFQRKIQLSGFSACRDGSASQLIRTHGGLLYCDFFLWNKKKSIFCQVGIKVVLRNAPSPSSNLLTKAVCSTESTVPTYQTTRWHNPEDHNTFTPVKTSTPLSSLQYIRLIYS